MVCHRRLWQLRLVAVAEVVDSRAAAKATSRRVVKSSTMVVAVRVMMIWTTEASLTGSTTRLWLQIMAAEAMMAMMMAEEDVW